jgi:N-acetylated-alpha-linked acidic dipeptidase
VVPHVSFAPLKNALQDLKIKASLFDRAVESLSASGKSFPRGLLAEVDKVLQGAERTLTREEGLPNRAWFKHFIYAPGLYTGYGVKTLPAVREAIEQRAWEQAEKGIQVTAEALRSYSSTIGRATELITR